MTRGPEDRADERAPIPTRAPPPRPRRLSRKALTLLSGVAALGIASALAYSLSGGSGSQAPQETVSVERRQTDLLSTAPRDYGDLAQRASVGLGPPPAQPPAAADPSVTTPQPAAVPPAQAESPEAQRRRQQGESAHGSALFAGNGGQRGGTNTPDLAAAAPPPVPTPEPAPASGGDAQSRRGAFLAGGREESTTNSGRLTAPAGRYVVSAGSTIAAALVTGLSSDLPGQVVAQVTEDVFDTVTGRTRLIPQGTRLLGTYDANVSTGQSRALVVWTRMILPDGRSIDLDRLIGTDAAGQSGFTDRVNNHWGAIIRAGLLSTLLGVGSQASGFGENDPIADAIRDSAGQTVGRAGDRIVERQLGMQPTITVRPGARVRVLVSRDLLLAPWPGA